MKIALVTIALLSLSVVACKGTEDSEPSGDDGESSGPADVSGPGFVATSASFSERRSVHCDGSPTHLNSATVWLSDVSSCTCERFQNASSVWFSIARNWSSDAPLEPGTYPMSESAALKDGVTTVQAGSSIIKNGALTQDLGIAGISVTWTGTIVLDEVSASLIQGNIDIANADGETFVGPFTAPRCGIAQKNQGDACTGQGIGSACN